MTFNPRDRQPASSEIIKRFDAVSPTRSVPRREDAVALFSEFTLDVDPICESFADVERCEAGDHDRSRCGVGYWRTHSMEVADMMEALATHFSEDRDLWWVVGMVHDADYPAFPHHVRTVNDAVAHPMALASRLHDEGWPSIAVDAVIEHSPHLGRQPSSRLSAALVMCDEHSTMSAQQNTPMWASDDQQEVLRQVIDVHIGQKSISGFFRDDMVERCRAAAKLLLS